MVSPEKLALENTKLRVENELLQAKLDVLTFKCGVAFGTMVRVRELAKYGDLEGLDRAVDDGVKILSFDNVVPS